MGDAQPRFVPNKLDMALQQDQDRTLDDMIGIIQKECSELISKSKTSENEIRSIARELELTQGKSTVLINKVEGLAKGKKGAPTRTLNTMTNVDGILIGVIQLHKNTVGELVFCKIEMHMNDMQSSSNLNMGTSIEVSLL